MVQSACFSSRIPSVLLVDDQEIIAAKVAQILDKEEEVAFHYCQNPLQAIEMANRIQPTVILQDLVMPEIDGLTLVKYFRANEETSNTPIIVLSSKEEGETKAEAFALGANDYVVKLPDPLELVARIRYHSQGYIHLLQRNEAHAALEENQRRLLSELNEAAGYVSSLLPDPFEKSGFSIRWQFVPSEELGGDFIGYHWLDGDHLAFYLLDVCGHGVGSALLAASVSNWLASPAMLQANLFDPAAALSRLNAVFAERNKREMFFTIWYGVYESSSRKLVYSSGGHPPGLLFSGNSFEDAFAREPKQLKTKGCVVAGLPDLPFENDEIQLDDPFSLLYIYSDGAFEIEDEAGKMMSFSTFLHLVRQESRDEKNALDQLLKALRKYQRKKQFADDFSFLQLTWDNVQ